MPSRRPGEEPIRFDPAAIAKRDEGWEESLEGLVKRWIEEVVMEVKEGVSGIAEERKARRMGVMI